MLIFLCPQCPLLPLPWASECSRVPCSWLPYGQCRDRLPGLPSGDSPRVFRELQAFPSGRGKCVRIFWQTPLRRFSHLGKPRVALVRISSVLPAGVDPGDQLRVFAWGEFLTWTSVLLSLRRWVDLFSISNSKGLWCTFQAVAVHVDL